VAGLRRPGASPVSEAPAPEVEVDETPVTKPAPVRRPTPRPAPRPAPAVEPSEPAAETEVTAVEAPEIPEAAEDEVVARPSPRAKARATAQKKPDDIEEAEAEVAAEADSDSDSEKPKKPGSRQLILAGALVVVGLLLAATAVLFKIQADEVTGSTENTALLDVAKTSQVKDQVAKATEALFSYDYNNIAKTEAAANELLVNDEVRAKYNLLMGEVKRLAPQQKMVVTCKVTRSAVIRLQGDRADVMVFVDQSSTRADTNKTTAGSAQLHLNAELQGDKWKITAMNTYAAPPNPTASSAPPAPTK
jgi:Mce-associated membrane protein